MFGFVKKAVSAVSDSASSALGSISETASNVSSSISDKASSAYASISESTGKASDKISDVAQSARSFADSVIAEGLLDLSSDFLKDEAKVREVSTIFWERIPREVRYFLSEDSFHERTKSISSVALLKVEKSKQNRILASDINAAGLTFEPVKSIPSLSTELGNETSTENKQQ